MKKNKKGFTLIELLAVIVIIAIIAMIALPIINNMIRKAREKAFLDTAYGVLEGAEWYYAKDNLEIGYNDKVSLLVEKEEKKVSLLENVENENIVKTAVRKKEKPEKIELPDTEGKLKIKGDIPEGVVLIKQNGDIALSVWSEDLKLCAVKDYNTGVITLATDKLSKEECTDGILIDNEPEPGDMWDGYITLELYYPEDSTDQKWQIRRTGEISSEWNDYEGPITIPIEDVENVYIYYRVKGKVVIVPPTGSVYVSIMPEKRLAKEGEKVKVEILASTDAKVEYRVGSAWEAYTGPFYVEAPTLIQAVATLEESVYDTEGNEIYKEKHTDPDLVYIGIEPPEAPRQCEIYDEEYYNRAGKKVNETEYKKSCNPKCELYQGQYYDKDGNTVSKDEYINVCKPYKCEKVESVYYDDKGNSTSESNYINVCKPYKCTIYNNVYYDENGNSTTKQNYINTCKPYKCIEVESIYYDNKGNVVANESAMNVKCGKYCKEINGEYYNTEGNVVTLSEYEKTCKPYRCMNRYGNWYNLSGDVVDYDDYRISCKAKSCQVIKGRYFDRYGYEVSESAYNNSSCVACQKCGGCNSAPAGPSISISPTSKTQGSVEVTITPNCEAREVYYKVGNGKWQLYTGPFKVGYNTRIYAYYIRNVDGWKSKESSMPISNILTYCQWNGLYVPQVSYTKEKGYGTSSETGGKYVDKVTIEGTSDGENLEYSLDGVVYKKYTGKITVTENGTVYLKDDNICGPNIVPVYVTEIEKEPSIKKKKYSVLIYANPEPETATDYSNSVKITIDYDRRATEKYYKIGKTGTLQTYNGPFTMTENNTVYAYAMSVTGYGDAQKQIDNLGNGIVEPIINANPNRNTQSSDVSVSIKYSKNAETMKYKIGSGALMDYVGPFNVTQNTTIYAENKDMYGNIKWTTYEVNNIVPMSPTVYSLENGKYYLIKLNYPTSSEESSREYNYDENGWTKYKDDGILLVTSSATIGNDGIIELIDENGKRKTFAGDYYVLSGSLSGINSKIKMRWNTGKPKTPTISLNTTEPALEVEVSINYDETSELKQYKIISPSGVATNWLSYTNPFKITEQNTMIYTRARNQAEVYSETGIYKITNIDREPPTIKLTTDLTKKVQSLKVRVTVFDDIKVDRVMYASGVRGKSYFKNNGTVIDNNTIITLTSNNDYTFYAIDGVGNEQVYTIKVENIDTTPPKVSIVDNSTTFGTQTTIDINFGDAVTKKYKVGESSSWQNYTGTINLTSDTVLASNLKNSDNTVTVCAQGTDNVGNVNEVCTKILSLDLDAPSKPIITSNAGYPVLSEYGIGVDGKTYIGYDKRKDIDNYYSSDGTTWKKYTGTFEQTSGTIYAKSVKKNSGLTVQSTKTIGMPGDALPKAAYDGNTSTNVYVNRTTRNYYLMVDSSMWNKKVYISCGAVGVSSMTVYTYDSSGKQLSANGTKSSFTLTIPDGAVKILFSMWSSNGYTDDKPVYLYEVILLNEPTINAEKIYPKLTEYGIETGYSNVQIDYFNTSTQKLYKIDDGDWQNYQGKSIKLELGKTIYAKGINRYGTETKIVSYTSALASDALPEAAYDGNTSTNVYVNRTTRNGYLTVDSSMWNKKIDVRFSAVGVSNMTVYAYDSAGNQLKSQGTQSSITFTIPSGTAKLLFSMWSSNGYTADKPVYLYEVSVINESKINVEKIYPKLTDSGVQAGYSNITIDYFNTSAQKLYKIDDGDWQNYQNKTIKMDLDKTIYAKGIDKNGTETNVTSYKSSLADDALPEAAYDGNTSTSVYVNRTTKNYYLMVDSSMYNKKINVNFSTFSDSKLTVYFYNDYNSELSSFVTKGSTTPTIPLGTTKILFSIYSTNGYTADKPANLYEISIVN